MVDAEPLIMYCSTCYYPALSVGNRTRLLKCSHVDARVVGLLTPMLSEMIDLAILKKVRAVAAESDHPLITYFHVNSSVSKELSLHKMQNGSLQQEFCACGNQNVK